MSLKSKTKNPATQAAFLLFLLLSFSFAQAIKAESPNRTVIAFGADADQNKPQPIWNTILNSNPDIFLFLGDNVYVDSADENIMRAAYAKFGAMPGFIKLLEKNIPIIATWDDHDYGIDDGGAEFSGKAVSQKVFLDFFRESSNSARRKQNGIYDAKIFGEPGRRVQIIALDTRYHKDESHGTLLGETQWQWFKTQLLQPAEVRIIISSIQVIAQDNGWENWGNLLSEKKRLFELIKKTNAQGVIFISGDRHFGELSAINAGIGYPLYDLTTGSLNKAMKKVPQEKNLYRAKKAVETDESFGLITIDWELYGKPQITLEIKNINGDSTIKRELPLSLLRYGVLPQN